MSNKINRGRPALPFNYPSRGKFTVNDCVAANPQIDCRLTIYTKLGQLQKAKKIRLTGKTAPSNGDNHVGKPLDIYQTMASYRISRSLRRANAARKAAPVPAPEVVA